MTKQILTIAFALTLLTANAQTKVTKAAIIGKWSLTSMHVDGSFKYDLEKDSLAILENLSKQLNSFGVDIATTAETMKSQMARMKKVYFLFEENGSFEDNFADDKPAKGTYSVNEETATITMSTKKNKKTENMAVFKNDHLVLTIPAKDEIPVTVIELKKL